MALVRLLAVQDLSGPKAYSPGRFSGRQLWHPVVLCRLYERSEAVVRFQVAPLSKSANRINPCYEPG